LAKEDTMEILLFALHLFIVADVPVAVGIEVHHAAELYQVDRYDLAATLVSEHSGPAHRFSFFDSLRREDTFSYPIGSEGQGGEVGLFQVKATWARKEGLHPDERYKLRENVELGAYVLAQAQESHAKHPGAWHHWIAHWKTGPGKRELRCGQGHFAQMKWKRIRLSLVSVRPVTEHIKASAREWRKMCRRDS
jgi:hypothetical protein